LPRLIVVGCVAQWLERWSLTSELPCPTLNLQLTTYVGKPSAMDQPTRPTQPFILQEVDKLSSKLYQMCAASFGWCQLVDAYGVKSGWPCGWQVKTVWSR